MAGIEPFLRKLASERDPIPSPEGQSYQASVNDR